MHKHKRRNEGIIYEAPNTRNKINDEVREELAGTETYLTDTQGLRLAYESPDRIYRNGSQLYIAGTKDPIDFYDDLKLPFYQTRNTKRYKDVDKFIQDDAVEIDGKTLTGITEIISHSLGSAVGQQINNDYGKISLEVEVTVRLLFQVKDQKTRGQTYEYESLFNSGSITLNRGTLNPFQSHSYQDIGNVHNKTGSLPITTEEFMQQLN